PATSLRSPLSLHDALPISRPGGDRLMRVLAGELKGQRLITPKGRTTRPTADQVRIACLDTLMPYLEAGPFLDLFAGAGGVGIEGDRKSTRLNSSHDQISYA